VLSRFDCDGEVFRMDANELVHQLPDLDLAYLDPPYNQHPYGSNYFMLNLLTNYREPVDISPVSGIPRHWQRSDYNKRARSWTRLTELIEALDARFILLSFNDEGFVAIDQLRHFLRSIGAVEEFSTRYNTFRGSRNLSDRPLHVTEHLFLTEKH
jgi:adenine-specific DNA-methyltransferase